CGRECRTACQRCVQWRAGSNREGRPSHGWGRATPVARLRFSRCMTRHWSSHQRSRSTRDETGGKLGAAAGHEVYVTIVRTSLYWSLNPGRLEHHDLSHGASMPPEPAFQSSFSEAPWPAAPLGGGQGWKSFIDAVPAWTCIRRRWLRACG